MAIFKTKKCLCYEKLIKIKKKKHKHLSFDMVLKYLSYIALSCRNIMVVAIV